MNVFTGQTQRVAVIEYGCSERCVGAYVAHYNAT
jgi:hypothetical protein